MTKKLGSRTLKDLPSVTVAEWKTRVGCSLSEALSTIPGWVGTEQLRSVGWGFNPHKKLSLSPKSPDPIVQTAVLSQGFIHKPNPQSHP
jgi:hypothetical protein